MKNPSKLWKDIVFRFSEQSQCKSRAVGALIVKDDFLISEGWNSAPRGSSTNDCPRDKCCGKVGSEPGKSLDQAICAHAEANAIANCAKRGVSTDGAELFSTTYPCAECAKLIVGAGVVQVTYKDHYPSPLTDLIFRNASVKVVVFNE